MGVVNAAHARGASVKVIIEAALLDPPGKDHGLHPGEGGRRPTTSRPSTGFGPGGERRPKTWR